MAAKDGHTEGRMRSRSAAEPPGEAPPVGLRRLGLDARGDHLLYVPTGYRLGNLAPLVVLLHGAGANSRDIMPSLRDLADAAGLILLAPTSREYTWDVIVSHGAHDTVLPVDRCSRRIVPELERAGYDVRYREFEGSHVVPPEIGREAVNWFAAGQN